MTAGWWLFRGVYDSWSFGLYSKKKEQEVRKQKNVNWQVVEISAYFIPKSCDW
jgi:hypothetical protein